MAEPSTSFLAAIDGQLDSLFAGWNVYSTTLVAVFVGYLFYPLFFGAEPDTHPLLLARQASASPVRQAGESATYRAIDIPYGYPLRSGLNVKDEGAPKWSAGRNGDLRDIWREAAKSSGPHETPIQLLSVKGKDEPAAYGVEGISKDINVIGTQIQSLQGKRVAIYLPNSVEFLVTLFACAFYGASPILIPQGQTVELLGQILADTKADILFASAGVVSQDELTKASSEVKHFVWIVEQTSRQLGFEPEVNSGNLLYHNLIEESKENATSDLPKDSDDSSISPVVSIWQRKKPDAYEIIEYSQANVVSAVAAQLAALHRDSRYGNKDLVLSLESLTLMFPLSIVLASLYSHASVAFTSVAGSSPDFDLAFQKIKPTIVIASAETIAKASAQKAADNQGILQKIHRSRQASSLAVGIMKGANTLLNQQCPRLIFTSERIGTDSVPLSPRELTDLRIFTGSRVVYALTTAKVAGAVAQTHVYDYREDPAAGKRSHFGGPLGSVELKVAETPEQAIPESADVNPKGHLVVSGPAVVGDSVRIETLAAIGDDHTLSLVE